MRQDRGAWIIGVLALAILFAPGCAAKSGSGTGKEGTAGEERISEQAIKEVLPRSLDRSEMSSRNEPGSAKDPLMDVLFDFDQDSLRADALPMLEAHAKRLKEDGVAHVLLEGRGDEVGTAAYNIVLGERRAEKVKTYLRQLGLSIDLKTASYGKDRPLCFQHTSECMQRNRSVHFAVKE